MKRRGKIKKDPRKNTSEKGERFREQKARKMLPLFEIIELLGIQDRARLSLIKLRLHY